MFVPGDRVTTKNPDLITDCDSKIGCVTIRDGEDYRVSFHCSTENDETKVLMLKEHQLLLVDNIIDWYFDHREDVESKYYINDSVTILDDYLERYSIDFHKFNRIGVVVDTYEGKCCVRFIDGKTDVSECWEIDQEHLTQITYEPPKTETTIYSDSPMYGGLALLCNTSCTEKEYCSICRFKEGDMVLIRNDHYYNQINNLFHNSHDKNKDVNYVGYIVSIETPSYNPEVEIAPVPYVTVNFGADDTFFSCTIPQTALIFMPTVAFDYIEYTKRYGGKTNVEKIIEELSHIEDIYNGISDTFEAGNLVIPSNNIIYQKIHEELNIRSGNHISLTGKVINSITTTGMNYAIVAMNEVTDTGMIEFVYHVAISYSDIVNMNDTGKMNTEMIKELWGSNEDTINCLIEQYWRDKHIERD